MEKQCPICAGRGKILKDCPYCRATTSHEFQNQSFGKCKACSDTGCFEDICFNCHGTGVVEADQRLPIRERIKKIS